jgi:AraC family L-rhamnose operon regulatory protein RhaS
MKSFPLDIERGFYQNCDLESLRLPPPLNIEHAPVKRQPRQPSRYVIDSCAPQKEAVASGKIQLHALTHGHYPGRLLPPRVLPGLSSLGYWDARGEQDWGLDPHRNEGIEIVFLETGRVTFLVDDRRYPLRPGAVTVTRPWQLHCLGDPEIGPGRLHWLILDVGVRGPNQPWHWPPWIVLAPEDLHELTRKLRHNEHPVWRGTPDIEHAFRELASCVQAARRGVEISRIIIHINHLLLSLLGALQRQSRHEDPQLTTRRRSVALFLDRLRRDAAHAARPWTLPAMAAECAMGTTAFAQYCRQIANQPPAEFLSRCRLDHAAQRLRAEPATPITSIAMDCGFASSQYFATCFQRQFARTPRDYRHSQAAQATGR